MPVNNKQNGSGSGILKKLKNLFGMNIGTMLFGVLFIYMLFSMILYLTSYKHRILSGNRRTTFPKRNVYRSCYYVRRPFTKRRPAVMLIIMPVKVPRSMQTV